MDLIDRWAVRIAEEAVPDEVDLAPTMARAYVEGGRTKDEMFQRNGGTVQGAFGPEAGMAVFPMILAAIQNTPSIPEFFDVLSGATGSGYYVAGAIGTILTIGSRRGREQKKEELLGDSEIKDIHARLREGIETVPDLDKDKADLITYRVLKAMLEDPAEASEFAKEIDKAS